MPRFAYQATGLETSRMPRKTGGRAVPLAVKRALGQELKRLRESRGQILEEVADAAGTDAGNIWRIENGRQSATLEMLFAICGHFRVPLGNVIKAAEGVPARAPLSPEAVKFAQLWEALPDGGKSQAEDYLIELATIARSIPTYWDGAAGNQRRKTFEEKLAGLSKVPAKGRTGTGNAGSQRR